MSSKKSKRGKGQRRTDLRIIYPEYFNKNLSWRMGRRVPKRIAYDDPELKRVAMAAQKAGFEVYLDKDKHYSKTWYEGNGRLFIKKDGSKEEQLRLIAKQIPKVDLPKPKKKSSSKKKAKKGSVYRQKKR